MKLGDVAQLGERRLCKAEVRGSSPLISINFEGAFWQVTKKKFEKELSNKSSAFYSPAVCRAELSKKEV